MEMDASEAHSILKSAARRGNAAIVIISVDDAYFVMQRKTEGYPYHTMVGGLCLFGGNKEETDTCARDTLVRELHEELPPSWHDAIEKTLRPFSRYIVQASESVMKPKPFSYAFVACAFHATLDKSVLSVGSAYEGKMELVAVEDLVREKFCWGYDTIARDFLREFKMQEKSFRQDYEKCNVTRISPTADLEEGWAMHEEWL